MVFAVRDLMRDAYPELNETADRVSKAVRVEETRFAHTMDVGLEKLETLLKGSAEQLAGEDAFKLYDTFGMPLDFMQDAARDQGIEFDRGWIRPRDGGAEVAGARFVEGCGEADGESGLPAASEIGVRRIPADAV